MDPAAADKRLSHLATLEQKVADRPESAILRAKLGTALLRKGATKRAEAELKKALELDPECVPAMVNLGGIYLNRWDFQSCVEINRKAAECRPDTVEAHYNEGLGHLYLSQPLEMVDCFRRVIELDENHPSGHYHLAVGLLAMGENAEASKELSIAMKLGFKPEPAFLKALQKKEENTSPSKGNATKH